MSMSSSFAWRMLRRDARAGELRLLAVALILAVAALTAVGFFTDRVRQALALEANQLLGADLLLIADHPWAPRIAEEARRRGLELAETRTFPSMVSSGNGDAARAQLAEIKAVSAGYPLRGKLRVGAGPGLPDVPAVGIPERGTVWVDERMAASMTLVMGEWLNVGRARLRVARLLTYEPDRGLNFFSVAPRLLMNLADVDATGLVLPGSRVSYRLLVAGEYKNIRELKRFVGKSLERGERVEDARNARPEIRSAIDRAQRFLGLAALMTVVLATVTVALASRRYMQRHLDPCAIMRCLGATQGFLLRVYLLQFLLLGFVASSVGCVVGFLAHFALHAWLAPLLATSLPLPTIVPAVQGGLAGLLMLFGFSLPPLLQLRRVATLRVLRREFFSQGVSPLPMIGGLAFGFVLLAALMFWVAGEVRLGAYVVGGFVSAMLSFAILAWLTIGAVGVLRVSLRGTAGASNFGLRYGLASLQRHSLTSIVHIVALAMGVTALLLLTVTHNELLAAWRRSIPAEAPNRFVVNIQPEQRNAVRQFFANDNLVPEFAPMVRGRLVAINGIKVGPERYDEDRAKRLVEREFNLSYRSELPEGNTVAQGRWFATEELGRHGENVASVEEGLARTLGLRVGDRLDFSVAGEPVSMRVVGLRKLNWDSMRVNFFVLTPPAVLEGYPASWITSFYLAEDNSGFVNRLVREFPNLTVIDVASIVRQLQSIVGLVARAVGFVFLFALAAGIVVLYAAMDSAADERRYELAVMRALGARSGQLWRAVLAELAVIGAISGLIAALAASVIGRVLALHIFDLELDFAWWLLLISMLAGAAVVSLAGSMVAARLVREAPLDLLRSGA